MKKFALSAALALSAVASAHAVTIDFDTLPGGGTVAANTVITNQYASVGVLFSMSDLGVAQTGPFAEYQYAALYNGLGLGNALWNCGLGCGPRSDTITISFVNAASDVSLLLDSEGGLPITFNAYDSGNNLLQTITTSSSFPSYLPVSFSVSGISRIDAKNPQQGWGWSMDQLSYTASAVPEAESGVLAVAGMAVAAAFLRRRKSA